MNIKAKSIKKYDMKENNNLHCITDEEQKTYFLFLECPNNSTSAMFTLLRQCTGSSGCHRSARGRSQNHTSGLDWQASGLGLECPSTSAIGELSRVTSISSSETLIFYGEVTWVAFAFDPPSTNPLAWPSNNISNQNKSTITSVLSVLWCTCGAEDCPPWTSVSVAEIRRCRSCRCPCCYWWW